MSAEPHGFPCIYSVADHHVSEPEPEPVVIDAERAGYETLRADQREAIERYRASGARAKRIQASGDELVSALTSCATLLRTLRDQPNMATKLPVTINESLYRADTLLRRIEKGA